MPKSVLFNDYFGDFFVIALLVMEIAAIHLLVEEFSVLCLYIYIIYLILKNKNFKAIHVFNYLISILLPLK